MQMGWLACERCETQELICDDTTFTNCQTCGHVRHAIDVDGKPLVVWSNTENLAKW